MFDLNDYQYKNTYGYRSKYMNPMITTNQKCIRDTSKKSIKKETEEYHKIKSSIHKGRNKKRIRGTEKQMEN